MPRWKNFPRDPRRVGRSAMTAILSIFGIVILIDQVFSGQWIRLQLIALIALVVSLLYAVAKEWLTPDGDDKRDRREQADKEARRALDEQIGERIAKAEPLIRGMGAGDRAVSDEAYRAYEPWKEETRRLLAESLGETIAGGCLQPPPITSREYSGSRKRYLRYHIKCLYALVQDRHNWEILPEFLDRQPSPDRPRENK